MIFSHADNAGLEAWSCLFPGARFEKQVKQIQSPNLNTELIYSELANSESGARVTTIKSPEQQSKDKLCI